MEETRVAQLGILVEDPDSVEALNALLHQYKDYIIGRMGLPYRAKQVNIISIASELGYLHLPENTLIDDKGGVR